MTSGWVHEYVSTACLHAQMEGRPELHAGCRNTCKFALGEPEYCQCPCHGRTGTQPGSAGPVDQARDIAAELLAAIREHPAGGTVLSPDLEERIRTDPYLFWLRGEVQSPGQWRAEP